jgi:N-acetylglucosamine malate deacetylase 2
LPASVLLIVSHPDDETLGCSHLLLRRPLECAVLYTTDGAPLERRFWAQAGAASREEYAHARRRELLAAMDVLGIVPQQIRVLPHGDRELARNLAALVREIGEAIAALRPRLIYTHAFEGGHPDHDSTSYAVARAVQLAGRKSPNAEALELREFTGYHARDGEFHSGAFLQDAGSVNADGDGETVALSAAEQQRKRAALDCYQSQQRVIKRFALSPEQWRVAPAYDFGRRPHHEALYYEIREMGYRFEDFRELVREADAALQF